MTNYTVVVPKKKKKKKRKAKKRATSPRRRQVSPAKVVKRAEVDADEVQEQPVIDEAKRTASRSRSNMSMVSRIEQL